MLGVFNNTDATEYNPTGDYAVGAIAFLQSDSS
jgi:hypothetical protein